MMLQWAQSLLHILLWFAVASIGGCASYWLLRLAPSRVRDSVGKGAVFVIVLCCLVQPLLILSLALFALLPSFASAFCERALDGYYGAWSSHFGISVLTYLLSLAINFAVFVLISEYTSRPLDFLLGDEASMWGVGLGFFLTPASISLSRWVISNFQIRPGIDRHLREGEVE